MGSKHSTTGSIAFFLRKQEIREHIFKTFSFPESAEKSCKYQKGDMTHSERQKVKFPIQSRGQDKAME